ncbi:MAG: FAD-dependent oxidoreductase [Phreatobacter sp.]|uniref:NAD(P)/FAD-dependent oxidoreductase n=1 Tax=Phreatobacter sp. TaxID=1966341 RepID=UPI00273658C8|nr:FAD-dependent oxidoreductase [Phreatobacter sp.]MDP2801852.1 FAD-dependent oxidoreductase [Phreatobacter sp.]
MDQRIVIVGASQAGLQTAVTLRQRGHAGQITMIGSEPHTPYQRPPLSKAFLTSMAAPESLALRLPDFYRENRIELIRGETVDRIDTGRSVIMTVSGREFAYERLALTVGAMPRRLDVPGHDVRGVLYLRDIGDALLMRELLPKAADVVVVGGGFIGLEAAAVCAKAGKRVTVVEASSRLLGRTVGSTMSRFFLDAHRKRGVSFRFETGVAEIAQDRGTVAGVRLTDGSLLPAEIVIVGIGAIPRTELAAQAGLGTAAGGILVDRFATTSDAHIVAAGDCAMGPHPMAPERLIRLESVQNATDQAKVAAATLLGGHEPYAGVPWFWSDQGDIKLQIAGITTNSDEFEVSGSFDSEQLTVSHFSGGVLTGVECVNRPSDYMRARRALGEALQGRALAVRQPAALETAPAS